MVPGHVRVHLPQGAPVTTGVSADELARVLAAVGKPASDPGQVAARYPPGNPVQAATVALTAALDTLAPLAPEMLCRVCTRPLDVAHADLGTHAECDPVPEVGEPAPLLPEVRAMLVAYEASRPRSTQVEIGPSEIAVPCDRRLAYRARGVAEQPDPRIKWAAMLGTAAHVMMADVLETDNRRQGRERWLVERRVWPDLAVFGSCDAYDYDHDAVIDWKLVGQSSLDKYRRHGPGPQYEGQTHIYGRGWQRAGLTPKHVRIVFLARTANFDDAVEWSAPYSRRVADSALDRMHRLMVLTHDLGVDRDPAMWGAVPATPGPDCRLCPFYRRGHPAADGDGCPGDVAATARKDARFNEGLIISG